MYKCSVCRNVKYFTELKNVATKVVCTDEGIVMPILSQDILLSVVDISCDICHASTEEDSILGDDGKVIDLSEQEDSPDIGFS